MSNLQLSLIPFNVIDGDNNSLYEKDKEIVAGDFMLKRLIVVVFEDLHNCPMDFCV